MLLETSYHFHPNDQCVFYIDPNLGDNDYIPQSGRLVWHKRKRSLGEKYLCGIEFDYPSEEVGIRLRQRIQKGLNRSTTMHRIGRVADGATVVAIIAILAFALSIASGIYQSMEKSNTQMLATTNKQAALLRDYNKRIDYLTEQLNSTNALYQESERMLTSVSKELMGTKAILTETENMLTEVRQEKKALTDQVTALTAQVKNLNGDVTTAQTQIQTLQAEQAQKIQQEQELIAIKAELESRVSDLETTNKVLTEEMAALNEQVRYYSGEVGSLEEGEDFLKMYKQRVKSVKQKIKGFRKEAAEARRAALIERDILRLELGNNGFLMKGGQSVSVDVEKYNSITAESIQKSKAKAQKPTADQPKQAEVTEAPKATEQAPAKPRVEVNVTLSDD